MMFFLTRFGLSITATHSEYVCMMSSSEDETRSKNVTWAVVDGRAVHSGA